MNDSQGTGDVPEDASVNAAERSEQDSNPAPVEPVQHAPEFRPVALSEIEQAANHVASTCRGCSPARTARSAWISYSITPNRRVGWSLNGSRASLSRCHSVNHGGIAAVRQPHVPRASAVDFRSGAEVGFDAVGLLEAVLE